MAAAASKLGKSLRPSNEQELGKIRIKLLNAGFRQEQAVAVFLRIKLICCWSAWSVAFPPAVIYLGWARTPTWSRPVSAASAFYLPDFVVGRRKKSRGESIFLGLPDALDLMVVCVEAGLGLDAAMRRVTQRVGPVVPGALRGIRHRQFPAPDGPPAQGRASRSGHPHGGRRRAGPGRRDHSGREVRLEHRIRLSVQSDAMRVRRRQLAEELRRETSVKIMLPLIVFIFPGVFVVLVGPAAINMGAMFATK